MARLRTPTASTSTRSGHTRRADAASDGFPGGTPLDPAHLIAVECDIWIPAARPDAITEENVDALRAQLVLEGANIPATAGAERALHTRGVLAIPDFIANAGGVICAAVEYAGGSEAQAFAAIAERVRRNVRAVLEEARSSGEIPRAAALRLATERVRRASSYRRFAGSK